METKKHPALPGIGRKTALRLAFGILDFSEEEALSFVRALAESETAPCMLEELFEEVFP